MTASLTLTSPEAVSNQISRLLGGRPLDSTETIAEALRHEISARGTSTRRTVCQQVADQLGAFIPIERDLVRVVLDDLERCGDVASAPGGRVAATPLRLVRTGGGRYAVISTIPASGLSVDLPSGKISERGIQRQLSVEGAVEPFEETVRSLGGHLIPVERWAGLDRVPPCGEEWLQQLAFRFESEKASPESWESDRLDVWMAYLPDASIPTQRRRWVNAAKAEDRGKLWRTRHAGGWWVYAWSEAGPPDQQDSLKLRQDDALRTAFSLDRLSEAPLEFSWTGDKEVALTVDGFLPRAEFRHLNVTGVQERDETGAYVYRFPGEVWPEVATLLTHRLGVLLKRVNP